MWKVKTNPTPKNATINNINYFPTFGGYLYICSDCNIKSISYDSGIYNCFDGFEKNDGCLVGLKNFKISEIEVFKII